MMKKVLNTRFLLVFTVLTVLFIFYPINSASGTIYSIYIYPPFDDAGEETVSTGIRTLVGADASTSGLIKIYSDSWNLIPGAVTSGRATGWIKNYFYSTFSGTCGVSVKVELHGILYCDDVLYTLSQIYVLLEVYEGNTLLASEVIFFKQCSGEVDTTIVGSTSFVASVEHTYKICITVWVQSIASGSFGCVASAYFSPVLGSNYYVKVHWICITPIFT